MTVAHLRIFLSFFGFVVTVLTIALATMWLLVGEDGRGGIARHPVVLTLHRDA